MSIFSRRSSVVLLAVAAIGTGALLGFAGWPEPGRTLEFCALILAGVVTASFATRSSTLDWTTMLPSFVVDFTTLLLLGPHATMLVVAAGAVARGLTDPGHAHPARRTLMDAATVLTATLAAGLVHSALGGTMGHFTWPEQALPIAAAVVAYCLVRAVLADVIVPLVTRQPVNRSWLRSILRGCPNYCIGGQPRGRTRRADRPPELAGVLVAAVPLYFAYRAYSAHVSRLEEERRRREVIESLDHGMSVVDSNGRITLWNDGLERILGCPRERALGRSLVGRRAGSRPRPNSRERSARR